ncbi:RluA family pseudouridine synthase [Cetobacterium ceti]
MEYIVEKNYEDVRLDKFLRKKFPDLPLTEIFKGIRVGKIKINGKKKKENYRLQLGDIIKIFLNVEMASKDSLDQEFIKLTSRDVETIKAGIVYEDKDIVIFNKKGEMVMHKGSGHDYGISEMMKSYYKNQEFNFVNRIDKSTSGLIIGAKDLIATRVLSEEIRENRVEKKYYILVHGIIKKDKFTIKNYLKKIDDKVVETDSEDKDGKISISYFKTLKRYSNKTLLEGTLETGRTHQLRVQLANMGNPIVGDRRYGAKDHENEMYLCSYYCEISKCGIQVEIPLPEHFKEKNWERNSGGKKIDSKK